MAPAVRMPSVLLTSLIAFAGATPIGGEVNATVWRPAASDFVWPELAADLPHLQGREDVGVALAGGGGRGMALAQGIVRALNDDGVLSRVRYLSVSSGAIWFAVPLYFQTKDNFTALIGKTLEPEELTPENLTKDEVSGTLISRLPAPWGRYPSHMNLTNASSLRHSTMSMLSRAEAMLAGRRDLTAALESLPELRAKVKNMPDFLDKFLECLLNPCSCVIGNLLPEGSSIHEIWGLITGMFLTRTHELGAPDSVYCHSTQLNGTQQRLGQKVTIYPSQDVKHNLPFLLSQSAVYALGSGIDNVSDPLHAFPLETTLMYSGVPVAYGGKLLETEKFKALGGIYVEPFASSSEPRERVPDGTVFQMRVRRQSGRANFGLLNEWQSATTNYFSMWQTHSWYVKLAKKTKCTRGLFDTILPAQWLWAPADTDSKGVPRSRPLPVGDAGIYDDNGHLPLLRRGVKKMVIFDSWRHHDSPEEEMAYTKAAFGASGIVDGMRTAPGAPNYLAPANFSTVFEPSEFPALWKEVLRLKAAKKPIVVRGNYTVLDNEYFGIKGGRQVEIIFAMALPVEEWRSSLPKETEINLPQYFPNMDSSELINHFHLAAVSQYGSWFTKHAVLKEMKDMLGVEPVVFV